MLFLEFRPVTRGRLRRSRVSFLILSLAALALYGWTAVTYAFPGVSAAWIAWAAGLEVSEVPTHPLLTLLGQWVAGVPYFSLALRLNLLAVAAGALVVGLVYKIVWFLIYEMMREESAVMHASRNARFGGGVAALAVAVSLPVWQAATRFRPEIFDVALLLACLHLLTVYARSQKVFWLLLFGLLYGAGVAESPLFIAAAPVMAAFAVITEWKLSWCRVGRLFVTAWLSLLVLVVIHYLSARSFASGQGAEPTAREIVSVVVAVLRDQFDGISAMLPQRLWFPVIVLGIGSAGLSFFAAFRTLDNRRSWSLYILSLVLTSFALLLLFNVPFSPWGVVAPQGVIPAATYTLTGMGIGLLAASWRALAVLNDPLDVDVPVDTEPNSEGHLDPLSEAPPVVVAASRGTGLLLVPVLVGMIGISGVLNGRRHLADEGAFADRAADGVLEGLQGRTWVVANGMIDANLLIRAHERGSVIHLLCPYRVQGKKYKEHVLRTVMADQSFTENAKLRAESLLNFNFHVFIDDLFAMDDAIGNKAVCMGLPDIWYGAGWVPVPERLFFGGVKTVDGLKGRDLMTPHKAFWEAWAPFLTAAEGSPQQLSYRHRAALRRHLAFLANNLGVTLDDLGNPEQAFDAYQKARAIFPDNISALLNVFEMISRGYHVELKDAVDQQLRRKIENVRERYPLWSLSRYYGYVRNVDLFVKMGWSWALSSSPGSVLAGLRSAYSLQQDDEKRAALTSMMASIYEMRGDYVQSAVEYKKALQRDPKNTFAISGLARLALQQSVVEDARKVLEAGEAAGAPKRQLRQDWAALYLVAGDLPRARVVLQELSEEPDASPMALAMLAMVMIEQQDAAAVETKILPRLAKATEGKDAYFVQVIQGRVWQNKGKSGYKNARLCFQRAAMIRPDVQALTDVLLMLDVALEEQKAAEAHALSILRQRPDQPYANFIMGSIRLEQGQYGDAETYLRRSTSGATPTLAALNNYAQVLCRIRKLEEAEKVARQAVERTPGRYEGWATLAFVLAEKNAPDHAAEALAKARRINAEDTRLSLVEALIAVKRGDPDTAEIAIAAVRNESGLSVADRRELKSLRDEIARLRQKRSP